jgi:predicted NBD/HSP70 family sugar kinase
VGTRAVDLGQRSETVRRANLSALLRALHLAGPLSRSELVARTGLTRSSIRSLVGELVAAGLAAEEAPAPSGIPGRPSPLVRSVPDGATVLALDVAVDRVAAALVGLGGTVFASREIDRAREAVTVESTVDELVTLVASLDDEVGIPDRVVGVGVAVAGLVRRADGMVRMAPNLGWTDVPLGAILGSALATDVPIHVANEADLGALAELRRGTATGVDDLAFIFGEVGVGGGIIVGGQPLTGAAGYGGEVGHMPVRADGRACRCGSTGCWETEVGEEALLALAGYPPDGGRAAVEALIAAAGEGDARALAALEEVGRWIGVGIVGLVNLLDPDLVIVGGLFARIHPYIRRPVEEQIERRVLPASRALVRVVPSLLGVDAPLIGAAELAMEPLLSDPAYWIGRSRGTPELASA